MPAKERDSKVSRVQPKRGAWHRVKRQISSDVEEVGAVAHLEITFESSFMSAESTGMVASTYHRNGYPLELGIFVHNKTIGRAEERRNQLAWMQKIALPTKRKLNPW